MLGIILQYNMKWTSNTRNLTKKVWKRMWIIRNFKRLGGTEEKLVKVYLEQIRNVLEMACSVWRPGLIVFETRSIECLQKNWVFFAIIRGQTHTSYRYASDYFNINLWPKEEKICACNLLKRNIF